MQLPNRYCCVSLGNLSKDAASNLNLVIIINTLSAAPSFCQTKYSGDKSATNSASDSFGGNSIPIDFLGVRPDILGIVDASIGTNDCIDPFLRNRSDPIDIFLILEARVYVCV